MTHSLHIRKNNVVAHQANVQSAAVRVRAKCLTIKELPPHPQLSDNQ